MVLERACHGVTGKSRDPTNFYTVNRSKAKPRQPVLLLEECQSEKIHQPLNHFKNLRKFVKPYKITATSTTKIGGSIHKILNSPRSQLNTFPPRPRQ